MDNMELSKLAASFTRHISTIKKKVSLYETFTTWADIQKLNIVDRHYLWVYLQESTKLLSSFVQTMQLSAEDFTRVKSVVDKILENDATRLKKQLNIMEKSSKVGLSSEGVHHEGRVVHKKCMC